MDRFLGHVALIASIVSIIIMLVSFVAILFALLDPDLPIRMMILVFLASSLTFAVSLGNPDFNEGE